MQRAHQKNKDITDDFDTDIDSYDTELSHINKSQI